MNEKKCSSQEASFYINDLFDSLEIKGNNQSLFNQFCQLFMKYSLKTIKKSWNDIFFLCDLPNGQIAGRLPKLYLIEQILLNNRIEKNTKIHNEVKKQVLPDGTVNKLFLWGKQYHDGQITKQELEKNIEENF